MAFNMSDILQPIGQDLEQSVTPEAIQLQQQAKVLLTGIETTYQKILVINEMEAHRNQLKNQIKSLEKRMSNKNTDPSEMVTISTEISSKTQELSAIKRDMIDQAEFNLFLQKVFEFQDALNAFLGQEVRVVFVYTDSKNTPILYEMTAQGAHNLKAELASRGGGITGRYKFSKKYLSQLDKDRKGINANQMSEDDLNFDLVGLQQAYRESITRGTYKKNQRKKGGLLILWQPAGSGWRKMFVSSVGDLNESYAAYFIQNQSDPDFNRGHGIEILLDQFLLGSSYTIKNGQLVSTDSRSVQQVDSVSGLLQGDITKEIDGKKIEYAVKSKGASMLSYEQIIATASAIVNMDPVQLSKEYLTTVKQRLADAGTTRNIATKVEDYVSKTWQDMIDQYLKHEI